MLIEAKIVAHHFEELFNKRRPLLRSLLVKFRVAIKRKNFFSLLERKTKSLFSRDQDSA